MGTNRALRLAAMGLALAGAGCSTVTPFGSINTLASGGQNFVAGRGSQVYPASGNFLEQARGALEDVDVRGIGQTRQGDLVAFEGKDPKGHHVVVTTRPESEGTKMRVHARFGTFGDEALTRAFLDRLAVRMETLPTEVKAEFKAPQNSPQLKLRANSAESPPGSLFQRRLDEGVREVPYP